MKKHLGIRTVGVALWAAFLGAALVFLLGRPEQGTTIYLMSEVVMGGGFVVLLGVPIALGRRKPAAVLVLLPFLTMEEN